jgi:hypothetical protein
MANFTEMTIRIKADTTTFDGPVDVVRKNIPQFWRGNDLRFEIGVFAGDGPVDVSSYASISLAIRRMTGDGAVPSAGAPALMQKVCHSLNNSVDLAGWEAGTEEHAVLSFSSAESNVVAGDHWLSIWATTADETAKIVTLCAGIIRVSEVGGGNFAQPPEPLRIYYTAEECDGQFVPLSAVATDPSLGASNVAIPSQLAVKSYVDAKNAEAGVGEVNAAANVGTGTGVFKGKNGSVLEFKSLKAGGNVTISSDDTAVTVGASGMANPMAASGDMVVGGGGGTPARLAKGTIGQVLGIGEAGPSWQNVPSSYALPIASANVLGGIKPDGTTLTVNGETGVASAAVSSGGGSPSAWLPGSDSIDLTVGGSGSVYNVTTDGWINVVCSTQLSNGWVTLSNNDDDYVDGVICYSSGKTVYLLFPVAAGDGLKMTYSNMAFTTFKLINRRGDS